MGRSVVGTSDGPGLGIHLSRQKSLLLKATLSMRTLICSLILACLPTSMALANEPLNVMFLGDQGHHQPRERFGNLYQPMQERGINIVYTNDVHDLNAETLKDYDAILLYANIDQIDKAEADALLKYVADGGAFVPVHCASFCFRNNPDVVALMGGQFKSHGTGVFTTKIAEPEHPIMKGYGNFQSWDETYVHHLHNEKDRKVLEYRVDGQTKEPWTWTRTQGDGRVFYTAWGHDQRTWNNPGFQDLVARGIYWSAKRDPADVPAPKTRPPFDAPAMTKVPSEAEAGFQYVDVGNKIPNYLATEKWGEQGEAKSTMQLPLSPEKSMTRFVTPEGFHVELYANEPELNGKPIFMSWDERGRMWVCETIDYPNELKPEGQGRDRIRICEDTDGDGKADKFTVFAEKLSIPTTLAFYRGGVIVQHATETLFLKDTNGDDKADIREVLISNWALGDTHGGVSNFRYGLDNWIWGMQGYNDSHTIINGKRQQGFRMGFFRFKLDDSDPPKVTDLEFIRSTDNNTWGLGISEEGIIFGSTANRNPSVYMPIANRYYDKVRGWSPKRLGSIADTHLFKPITEKIRQVDQHGGYTAGAGHALYTARTYPETWWNRTAFVCGPTGHLVGTFVLTPHGADFSSTSPINLLASDDEWCAPIMAEVGPDGNMWVLDWYNYIVQHNPTPKGFQTGKGNAYETDLRDKKHGRVYRVIANGGSQTKPLSKFEPEDLVNDLKSPNMLNRLHAQRLLIERGNKDVLPQLMELLQDRSTDAIGLNTAVIHALWTMKGLGVLDGSDSSAQSAVIAALDHPSAGVRRNAVAVLPLNSTSVEAILAQGMLKDTDAQVRLATLLALSDMPPSAQAGPAILTALVSPMNANDHWMADAATTAAATHSDSFLKAAAAESADLRTLLPVSQIVAEHVARGGSIDDVVSILVSLKSAPTPLADAVIAGILRGWPSQSNATLTDAQVAQLEELFTTLSMSSQGALVKLGQEWKSEKLTSRAAAIAASLFKEVDNTGSKDANRLDIAEQIVTFQPTSDDVVTELLDRVTPQNPVTLTKGIIQALSRSEAKSLGSSLVSRLDQYTPDLRKEAINTLLRRPAATASLLDALNDGSVQLSELTLDQKQALATHPDRKIRTSAAEILKRGGAVPNPDRQKVLTEYLVAAKHTGSVEKGMELFKAQCAKCHTHQDMGTKIGPDLTGMAVHPKAEMLNHILDPNRDVEGNYRVYTLATTEGLVINGLLASESTNAVELIDAEGKKQTVLREDIELLSASTKSLMPEGFEKQFTIDQMTDLLEFLSHKGKYLPLDLTKVATYPSSKGMFLSVNDPKQALVFDSWTDKKIGEVPFHLIDPKDGKQANVILLNGPQGPICSKMPKSVSLPCSGQVKTLHILGGISGWGYPYGAKGSDSMIIRFHYEDKQSEDHVLKNGIEMADYIQRVDVPGSKFAFDLRGGNQLRYLTVSPERNVPLENIEILKGSDQSAPVIMSMTLEMP